MMLTYLAIGRLLVILSYVRRRRRQIRRNFRCEKYGGWAILLGVPSPLEQSVTWHLSDDVMTQQSYHHKERDRLYHNPVQKQRWWHHSIADVPIIVVRRAVLVIPRPQTRQFWVSLVVSEFAVVLLMFGLVVPAFVVTLIKV